MLKRTGEPDSRSIAAARKGTVLPLRPHCGMLTIHFEIGCVMSTPLTDLEAQVLSLPAEDRVRLLDRLIASFEPRMDAQDAWMQLALHRQDDVHSGKTLMSATDDTLARVRARIA